MLTLPSILIVGNRRTGRSTLALELVRRLGAPHLDVFCHETEWKNVLLLACSVSNRLSSFPTETVIHSICHATSSFHKSS